MLGALVLVYGFLFSRDFLIASVVVRGTSLGDPADVVISADAIGESIFRIDAGHAAQRVANLPYVEQATVEARFPDKVVITVVERSPAVIWKVGEESFVIDARGHVLAYGTSPDLPLLTVDGNPPTVGGAVDPAAVGAAAAISESLGDQADVYLTTDDGPGQQVVVFGDPVSIPLKLVILTEVIQRDLEWSLLDLREPARPYYK
jgi:cell division septal protein FtsQ